MCQVTRENQAIFHIIIVGGVFLEKKVIKEGLSYFYTNDADRLILLLNDLINYRDRTILTCRYMSGYRGAVFVSLCHF